MQQSLSVFLVLQAAMTQQQNYKKLEVSFELFTIIF